MGATKRFESCPLYKRRDEYLGSGAIGKQTELECAQYIIWRGWNALELFVELLSSRTKAINLVRGPQIRRKSLQKLDGESSHRFKRHREGRLVVASQQVFVVGGLRVKAEQLLGKNHSSSAACSR
jgi:hypothetical protein